MLVAVVAARTLDELYTRCVALPDVVDMVELRLDHLQQLDTADIKAMICRLAFKVLLTLRSTLQGGKFSGARAEYIAHLKQLAQTDCDYLDVEYHVEDPFVSDIAHHCGHTRLVRSYHHCHHTPNDLNAILQGLQHPDIAHYKIVTTANSSIDSLRMLAFVRRHAATIPLTAHAQGETGFISRLLGRIHGSCWFYAASKDDSATLTPGCPSINTLLQRYHIDQLNAHTRVYGLIGLPIAHSIGDRWHNQYFHQRSQQAVYVKILLSTQALPAFFKYASQFFAGLSVTTPLKEAVMPYVSDNVDALTACNTLAFCGGRVFANHTDGQGVLACLPQNSIKRVLLIGAGGAAQGILPTLVTHLGAEQVWLTNRTITKAQSLARGLDVKVCKIQAVNQAFDVIINTLPNVPDADHWLTTYLDRLLVPRGRWINIDYAHPSSMLLTQLRARGRDLIDGKTVFAHQALAQQQWWATWREEIVNQPLVAQTGKRTSHAVRQANQDNV